VDPASLDAPPEDLLGREGDGSREGANTRRAAPTGEDPEGGITGGGMARGVAGSGFSPQRAQRGRSFVATAARCASGGGGASRPLVHHEDHEGHEGGGVAGGSLSSVVSRPTTGAWKAGLSTKGHEGTRRRSPRSHGNEGGHRRHRGADRGYNPLLPHPPHSPHDTILPVRPPLTPSVLCVFAPLRENAVTRSIGSLSDAVLCALRDLCGESRPSRLRGVSKSLPMMPHPRSPHSRRFAPHFRPAVSLPGAPKPVRSHRTVPRG